MLFQKSWQPVPDVGEQWLKTVGQENALWHQYRQNPDLLIARSDQLVEGIAEMVGSVIDEAMAEGSLTDLDKLPDKLNENQRYEVARAYLAAEAIAKFENAVNGGSSFDQPRRFRLTVLKRGVYKSYVDPSLTLQTPGAALEIEHEEVGSVDSLRSFPPFGGVLKFGGFLEEKRIHGLVNPVTGDPLVHLEILEKRK